MLGIIETNPLGSPEFRTLQIRSLCIFWKATGALLLQSSYYTLEHQGIGEVRAIKDATGFSTKLNVAFSSLGIHFIVVDLGPVSRASFKLSYFEIFELLRHVDYCFSSNLGHFGHFFKKFSSSLFFFLFLTLYVGVLSSVSCFSKTLHFSLIFFLCGVRLHNQSALIPPQVC